MLRSNYKLMVPLNILCMGMKREWKEELTEWA